MSAQNNEAVIKKNKKRRKIIRVGRFRTLNAVQKIGFEPPENVNTVALLMTRTSN
jgi:hypothetical protein